VLIDGSCTDVEFLSMSTKLCNVEIKSLLLYYFAMLSDMVFHYASTASILITVFPLYREKIYFYEKVIIIV